MFASRRLAELRPPLDPALRLAQLRRSGHDVLDLCGAETEPLAPEGAADALAAAARRPEAARAVPRGGLPEYRQAVARWYARRYGVRLDPDAQVLPLAGGRQGLFLVSLCCCDPGDVALVPDPSFGAYRMGAYFAGAEVVSLPLRPQLGYLPDLGAIPEAVARRARVLFLNYPNDPTGAVAPTGFFADAIAFARRHGLLLCHDFAHGETGYDGCRPQSLLALDGALQTGLEFVTLSTACGLPGWRLGAAVGCAEAIAALFAVTCHVDGGVCAATQLAGATMLEQLGLSGFLAARNETYRARRDLLAAAFEEAGLRLRRPRASPFLWVPCPPDVPSAACAGWLLERLGLAVTPGSSFGAAGEGFVRVCLLAPTAQIEDAAARVRALGRGGLAVMRRPVAPRWEPAVTARRPGNVAAEAAEAATAADALLGSL